MSAFLRGPDNVRKFVMDKTKTFLGLNNMGFSVSKKEKNFLCMGSVSEGEPGGAGDIGVARILVRGNAFGRRPCGGPGAEPPGRLRIFEHFQKVS